MDGYQVYKYYVGLKTHFKTLEFDFHKYGPINFKFETYEKRSDRYMFEKLAKKHNSKEIIEFLVANFIMDENIWTGDLISSDAEDNYLRWKKNIEGLEYNFSEEVKKIKEYLDFKGLSFKDLFKEAKNSSHPLLLKLVLQKNISPETYCIMDAILGFSSVFDVMLKEDPVWLVCKPKYSKYYAFLKVSETKKKSMKNTLKQVFLGTSAT